MFEEFRQLALLVGDVHVAGAEVDLDIVDRGELKQMRLGFLGKVEQRLGALESVFRFKLLGAGALAGAELPAIPARRPVAEAVRFEQHDRRSHFGKMHGCRQAGETAADDDDVAGAITVERGIIASGTGSVFVPGIAGGDGGLVSHDAERIANSE